MENYEHDIFEKTGLDETGRHYLLDTVRWSRFLAIMGMIFLALMICIALYFMFSASYQLGTLSGASGLPGIAAGLIYIVATGLNIYPVYCLSKFSSCMKRGIVADERTLINEGFRHQKNMYKYMGILTLVVIGFYVVIFVIAMMGAVLG